MIKEIRARVFNVEGERYIDELMSGDPADLLIVIEGYGATYVSKEKLFPSDFEMMTRESYTEYFGEWVKK